MQSSRAIASTVPAPGTHNSTTSNMTMPREYLLERSKDDSVTMKSNCMENKEVKQTLKSDSTHTGSAVDVNCHVYAYIKS